MFRLLPNPVPLRKILHAHTRISAATAPSVTNGDEDEDNAGGVTQFPCLIGGACPPRFSLPFHWKGQLELHTENPPTQLAGPSDFVWGAERKEENLMFLERCRGKPARSGFRRTMGVSGAGWEPRLTLGSRGKQHQPLVHPLGPDPLQPTLRGDPRRAGWASESANHWGRRPGPEAPGVWGVREEPSVPVVLRTRAAPGN